MDRLAGLGWSPSSVGTFANGYWQIGETATVNYPSDGFAVLEADGGSGYWFDHRADEVARHLGRVSGPQTIWEVGAGSGAMSRRLEDAGYDVVAVEPFPVGAVAIARDTTATVFCGVLEDLALPSDSLPAVGLFDVLEHLSEPGKMLEEVRRVLRADGHLAVTVPAYAWLWSDEDDFADHQTRYSRGSLNALLKTAGFVPEHVGHLYASLVLPAALTRSLPYKLGRRRTHEQARATLEAQLDPPRMVDAVARRVLRVESALSCRRPLPFGTSLIGIYRPV